MISAVTDDESNFYLAEKDPIIFPNELYNEILDLYKGYAPKIYHKF